MLQLSEDMMRARRRFDASGRPLNREIANEVVAQKMRSRGEDTQPKPGLRAVLRDILTRHRVRHGPAAAAQRS